MKKSILILLPLALLALAVPAQAQMRFGVRAGITDGDPMIGGEVLIPLRGDFVANPTIELTSKLLSANADFHYDFRLDRRASWWLGAGAAFLKPDNGDSDIGVSLLGGYGTRYRDVYPYAQVRITSASNISDFASFAVGLRF